MNDLFFATAKDGKLEFSNQRQITDFLKRLDKKSLWIKIGRMTGQRSLHQNDYLWAVVYKVIADSTGHSDEDIHIYCRRFLPRRFKQVLGEMLEDQKSTTKMNKVEFGEYIEKIRVHFVSYGIVIPDPKK